MNKDHALSVLRHTLTFLGGLLVYKGTIDEGSAQELGGAVMTFVGILWGQFDKRGR